jgi:hypothetical protein
MLFFSHDSVDQSTFVPKSLISLTKGSQKQKMIFQFTAKWLTWSVLLLPFGLSCGDQIDIKMEEAMKKMNVRGASLVFFDKVSNMLRV